MTYLDPCPSRKSFQVDTDLDYFSFCKLQSFRYKEFQIKIFFSLRCFPEDYLNNEKIHSKSFPFFFITFILDLWEI